MKVVVQVDQDVRKEEYKAGSKALREAIEGSLSEVEGLKDATEISSKEHFPLAEGLAIAGSVATLVMFGHWTYEQLRAFWPVLERRLPKGIRIRIRARVKRNGDTATADESGPAEVACGEVQKALEAEAPDN